MYTLYETCIRVLVRHPFQINFRLLPGEVSSVLLAALRDNTYLEEKRVVRVIVGSHLEIATRIYRVEPKSPLIRVYYPGNRVHATIMGNGYHPELDSTLYADRIYYILGGSRVIIEYNVYPLIHSRVAVTMNHPLFPLKNRLTSNRNFLCFPDHLFTDALIQEFQSVISERLIISMRDIVG